MLFPRVSIVTSSIPDTKVCEVHDAEHELELVDVHENVEVLPKTKEVGVAVRLTVGNGLEPDPPHEAKKNKHIVRNEARFICVKLNHKYSIVRSF